MLKPLPLLAILLVLCAAFFAFARPSRRVEVNVPPPPAAEASAPVPSTPAMPVPQPMTREAAKDPAEAIPVILENATACQQLGARKYDLFRILGADLFRNEVFKEEDAAVARSLALQQRLLDEGRAAAGQRSVETIAKLFAAESALCDLVSHPRGTLIQFGSEQERLVTDINTAKAEAQAVLGAAAFGAPMKPEYSTEVGR